MTDVSDIGLTIDHLITKLDDFLAEGSPERQQSVLLMWESDAPEFRLLKASGVRLVGLKDLNRLRAEAQADVDHAIDTVSASAAGAKLVWLTLYLQLIALPVLDRRRPLFVSEGTQFGGTVIDVKEASDGRHYLEAVRKPYPKTTTVIWDPRPKARFR